MCHNYLDRCPAGTHCLYIYIIYCCSYIIQKSLRVPVPESAFESLNLQGIYYGYMHVVQTTPCTKVHLAQKYCTCLGSNELCLSNQGSSKSNLRGTSASKDGSANKDGKDGKGGRMAGFIE